MLRSNREDVAEPQSAGPRRIRLANAEAYENPRVFITQPYNWTLTYSKRHVPTATSYFGLISSILISKRGLQVIYSRYTEYETIEMLSYVS